MIVYSFENKNQLSNILLLNWAKRVNYFWPRFGFLRYRYRTGANITLFKGHESFKNRFKIVKILNPTKNCLFKFKTGS